MLGGPFPGNVYAVVMSLAMHRLFTVKEYEQMVTTSSAEPGVGQRMFD